MEYEKDILHRFLPKIQIDEKGCWYWNAFKDQDGYGRFHIDRKQMPTHRFILMYYLGIDETKNVVDHLCRNTSCVNPAHLEFTTNQENILRGINFTAMNARKTHCPRGHSYNSSNTYVRPSGSRECRICVRISDRKYRQKIRSLNQ